MSEQRKKRPNSSFQGRNGSSEHLHSSRPSGSQNRSKMNSSQSKSGYTRQTSYDHVRRIVQEEGRTARNLVTWSVPVEAGSLQEEKILRKSSKSPVNQQSPGRKTHRSVSASTRHKLSRDVTPPTKKHPREERSSSLVGEMSTRICSSLRGKKGDLRARYWAFLFENLRRAVDEIYQTCETDESVVECKETIMMLQQCTKDFQSLIERMQILEAFENAEEGQKPTSLAWEVRKSSPGKGLTSGQPGKDFMPSPTVSRSLNFGSAPAQVSPTSIPNTTPPKPPGNSWADKVRGITPIQRQFDEDICATSLLSHEGATGHYGMLPGDEMSPDEDSEGWEVVHRISRAKTRPLSAGYRSSTNQMRATPPYQRLHTGSSEQVLSSVPAVRPTTLHKSVSLDQNGNAMAEVHDTVLTTRRERADSGDSEKENVKPVSVDMVLPKSASADDITELKDADIRKSPEISIPRRGWEKTETEVPASMPSVMVQSSPAALNVSLGSTGTEPISDTDIDQNKIIDDDLDDDQLTTELENALVTAMEEEDSLSKQLEQAQEAALQSAIREEESYLQEIAREQSMEIDVETENESELGNTHSSHALESSLQQSMDWDTMVKHYETDQDSCSTLSWGEQVEEAETRTPGRCVHMHEKLSSPSRKRSVNEARRRHEEKQAKARELREKLLQDKSERLRTLTRKVEEVCAWKDELLLQRRITIERKLHHAEEKRQVQLQSKVRKAHEEETKANEIAFINTLEAQNKRHDIIAKHQESEARLHDLQEERQRKHEEKAAKEAAVEERRRALEADRTARLADMQERRRVREEEFESRQHEKEKERLVAARSKEREREERIAALNAQQQQHIEELTRKIQAKQEESGRRHREQIEHIQGKALAMSILHHSVDDHQEAPHMVPYDVQKFCQVCNVMIPSEVFLSSHLRGKKHQQSMKERHEGKELSREEIESFNLKHISDAPSDKADPKVAHDKERQKALKKRCKKLRQRMSSRGSEYETAVVTKSQGMDSDHKTKLQKLIKDVNKYLQSDDSGPWPPNKVSALDRALGETGRIMERKAVADQSSFRQSGGLTTLCRILLVIGQSSKDVPPVIPIKSLTHTSTVLRLAVKGCYDNCHYALFSNKISSLVDLLMHQLNLLIPDNFNAVLSSSGGATVFTLPYCPLASGLMQLIAAILSCLGKHNPSVNSSEASAERMSTTGDAFMSRANDIVSYVISLGILDKLAQYFNNVRGPIDSDPKVGEFLQHSMGLLIALIRIISKRTPNLFDTKRPEDHTQLISTLSVTGLVGIVSLMYGMLLHSGATTRGDVPPPELPAHTVFVATVGFKMLNHLALLDLHLLQASLGEEGTSLEFRHIASYLIWYCQHWGSDELLHEVVLCVGYFTVLNHDNQVMIQSGQSPTVLQQLCSLPFQYFSDPRLTAILFPTLISCCHGVHSNSAILQQELSCALLANFIEEKNLEAQTRQSPKLAKKSKTADKDAEARVGLAARFPPTQWTAAQDFFNDAAS